jgi:hypothetical protein
MGGCASNTACRSSQCANVIGAIVTFGLLDRRKRPVRAALL